MNGKRWLIVLSGLAIGGCIPTLHPIYTDRDLVFEPALVGTWREDGTGTESWAFSNRDEKSYTLIYTDRDGLRAEFTAHLARLDGRLFLDLYPAHGPEGVPDFYALHLIPVHTFLRVDQIQPTLRMAMMDPKWFEKLLQEHPQALRHEVLDGADFLVTASTKELQVFVSKHAATPEAWGETSDMSPVPQTQPAETQPAD